MEEDFAAIEQLDFHEFTATTDAQTRRAFAEKFVSQFAKPNAGFARLVNHGFDIASRDALVDQWDIFFQLPKEVKERYFCGPSGQIKPDWKNTLF